MNYQLLLGGFPKRRDAESSLENFLFAKTASGFGDATADVASDVGRPPPG